MDNKKKSMWGSVKDWWRDINCNNPAKLWRENYIVLDYYTNTKTRQANADAVKKTLADDKVVTKKKVSKKKVVKTEAQNKKDKALASGKKNANQLRTLTKLEIDDMAEREFGVRLDRRSAMAKMIKDYLAAQKEHYAKQAIRKNSKKK